MSAEQGAQLLVEAPETVAGTEPANLAIVAISKNRTSIFEFDIPEDWEHEAACQGRDPKIFFPEKNNESTLRAARQICSGCPVGLMCLAFALQHNMEFGVWGGKSERERRTIKRRRSA